MRTILLAGVFMVASVSGMHGQAKDSAIDLADVSDKPAILSHPDLGYKDCYKNAGLTGTDVVKFVVDTTGHVDPTSVGLTQVTHPILDSLAVRVVRGMVFTPGAMAGAKVRVSVGLPVHFGGGAAAKPPQDQVFAESCVDQKAQAPDIAMLGHESIPKMLATPGMVSAQTTTIWVRVVVRADGLVSDATVEGAGTSPEMAQTATTIARRMRFRPARINGIPVATTMAVPVPATLAVQVTSQ